MKISSFIISAMLLIGTQAHAIHAYRNEACSAEVGKKIIFIKRSLYNNLAVARNMGDADGLDTIYTGLKDTDEVVTVTGKESLELNVLSENNRKASSYDDGCLIGEEGTFKRSVDVQRLSAEAKKKFSLTEKQSLDFLCEFEEVFPIGNECNQ